MFLTVNQEELHYALCDLMNKGLILNEMDEDIQKDKEKWGGRVNTLLLFEVIDYCVTRLNKLSYELDEAGYTPENALEGYKAIYPTLEFD